MLRQPAVRQVAGAVLVLVALAMWAFASPVGASPDEDYHLASIWCAGGDRDGVCEPGSRDGERLVPEGLLDTHCYAFHPEMSAACQGTALTDPTGELAPTTRANFNGGDYPPVFYAAMSVFVGQDVSRSVLAMRVANAVVFVLGVAAAFALASAPLRRALVAAVAVTFVPLGVFIVPSINPSSWAMTSAALTFVALVVHMTERDRTRQWLSGALAGAAVLLGAGARADAALYASLAVGAALAVTFRPRREFLVRAVYPAVLGVASALSFFMAGQSSAVEGAEAQAASVSRVVDLLTDVPELWVGALGKWGLGWLDTSMPPIVWVAMFGLFATAVVTGLRGVRRGQAVALAVVALAAWLIPAYIQYLSGVPVGMFVQPRYIHPLLVILAVVALCRLTGEGIRVSPAQRWLAVLAVSGANALALHLNIGRYVAGTDAAGLNLGATREWWWQGAAPGPMAVWLLGSAALAGALVLLSHDLVAVSPAAPGGSGDDDVPGQDTVLVPPGVPAAGRASAPDDRDRGEPSAGASGPA